MPNAQAEERNITMSAAWSARTPSKSPMNRFAHFSISVESASHRHSSIPLSSVDPSYVNLSRVTNRYPWAR